MDFTFNINELKTDPKGKYICPFCNSGGHSENSDSAFHIYYSNNAIDHAYCFSCKNIFYESNIKTENNSYIVKAYKNVEIQEFPALEYRRNNEVILSNDDKKKIINSLYGDRSYSSAIESYLLANKDFFFSCYQNNLNLSVPICDINKKIISFQRVYKDFKGALQKRFLDKEGNPLTSTKGFYYVQGEDTRKIFVVESFTNSLALLSLGFSSVCCFNANNCIKLLSKLILAFGDKVILCLDRDKNQDMKKESNKHYISCIDWQNIEKEIIKEGKNLFTIAKELGFSQKQIDCMDVDLFYRIAPKKLHDYLFDSYFSNLSNPLIARANAIKECLNKKPFNIIIAPTGSGKTHAVQEVWNEQSLMIATSQTNASEFCEQVKSNIILSKGRETILKKGIGLVICNERRQPNKNCNRYKHGSNEELKNFLYRHQDEFDRDLQFKNQVLILPYREVTLDDLKDKRGNIFVRNIEILDKINSNKELEDAISKGREVRFGAFSCKPKSLLEIENGLTTFENEQQLGKNSLNFDYVLRIVTHGMMKNFPIDFFKNPNNFIRKEGSNLFLLEIDCNSLKEQIMLDYNTVRDTLLTKKQNESYFAILSNYFFKAYIVIAFPIYKDETGKESVLSYDEYVKKIHQGQEKNIVKPNNNAIYFCPVLHYMSTLSLSEDLKACLENNVHINYLSATKPIFFDSLKAEIEEIMKGDFSYNELENKRLLNDNVHIFFKNNRLGLKKFLSLYKLFFSNKNIRFSDVKNLKENALESFYLSKKVSFLDSNFHKADDIKELDNIAYYNIVTYALNPYLRGSNYFKDFNVLILDCNICNPKAEDCNPYQTLEEARLERIRVILIQAIGRYFRKEDTKENKVILLHNVNAVTDKKYLNSVLTTLEKITDSQTLYIEDESYNYGMRADEIYYNILQALHGEPIQKYQQRITHEKKHKDYKEEIKTKVANGASIKEATNGNNDLFTLDEIKELKATHNEAKQKERLKKMKEMAMQTNLSWREFAQKEHVSRLLLEDKNELKKIYNDSHKKEHDSKIIDIEKEMKDFIKDSQE